MWLRVHLKHIEYMLLTCLTPPELSYRNPQRDQTDPSQRDQVCGESLHGMSWKWINTVRGEDEGGVCWEEK